MAINNLLVVSYNDENGQYNVTIPQGSNVPETMFSMAVIIKVLVRDGHLKNYKEALNMIKRYCTDTQFEEVKEDPFEKEEKEDGKTEEK